MKILIVDDVGYVRHYLEQLLTRHGYSVATAPSGNDALDRLKSDNSISVVITDLLMPGMDGIELFKASRKIDRYTDEGQIPPAAFILVTALRPNASMQRREACLLQQALDLGFTEVMLKPVDNTQLLRTLQKLQHGTAPGVSTASETAPAGGLSAPQTGLGGCGAGESLQESDVLSSITELRVQVERQFKQLNQRQQSIEERLAELMNRQEAMENRLRTAFR